MALKPVRIVAVSAIVRAYTWLHISDVPWLGAEDSEEGERVHGPCSDLGVAALHDGASDGGPVVLQPLDCLLEGQSRRGASLAGGGGGGGRRECCRGRPIGIGAGR